MPPSSFTDDGWMLNKDVFDRDSLIDEVEGVAYGRPPNGQSAKVIENLKFRPYSDYPVWYTQHLRDAPNIKFPIFSHDLLSTSLSLLDKLPGPKMIDYEDHCADTKTFKPFDYARANKDIHTFCRSSLDLISPGAAPLWTTFDHTHDDINMKLHLGIQWTQSAKGQEGCNAYQNFNHIDEGTCVAQFLAAINRWNKDTITRKYGQYPGTWNAPGGCVDFWWVGHDEDSSCDDLDVDPVECTGKKRDVGS